MEPDGQHPHVFQEGVKFRNADLGKHRVAFAGVQHPHMWTRLQLLLQELTMVEIVGFYDDDADTAAKFADKLPQVKQFSSLKDLLVSEIDTCFIHALDHDVPRYAREVLKYPVKGLLLEKPGAAVPQDLLNLAAEIEENHADRIIEFGWEMHYSEAMNYAREILASNALGTITSAHFHGGTPSGAALEKWQVLDSTLGGYVYTDGSHTLEQVIDLFGKPQKLIASVRVLPESEEFPAVVMHDDLFGEAKMDKVPVKVGTLKTEIERKPREDIASVILEYADKNVTVDFTAWEAHQWCEDWTTDIYGTNGTLHTFLDPTQGYLYLRSAKDKYPKGNSKLESKYPIGQHAGLQYFYEQLVCFLQRVEGKQDVEKCDLVKQIPLMQTLQAIFRSAETRSFVEV